MQMYEHKILYLMGFLNANIFELDIRRQLLPSAIHYFLGKNFIENF